MSITQRAYKSLALLVFALLTACGAVDEPDLYYDDTSLYLHSVEYKRNAPVEGNTVAPGEVIVRFDEGKQDEQQKQLADIGLSTRMIGTVTVVTTKPGFEEQLARALMDQKLVRLALPNYTVVKA